MELVKFEYGRSTLGNPLVAYHSPNFYNDKYLYCIAGVHGDKIEGIKVVENLMNWLTTTQQATFPCVLIPVFDIDSYLYQESGYAKARNLNNLFPTSLVRKFNSSEAPIVQNKLPLEIAALSNLLLKYPPQLVMNFRTADKHAKIITIGEEAHSIGSFLSKTTNFPLIADNSPAPKTLEAFIYDFFLCPVISVRLPFFTENKSVAEISTEFHRGIEQLFTGQIY